MIAEVKQYNNRQAESDEAICDLVADEQRAFAAGGKQDMAWSSGEVP